MSWSLIPFAGCIPVLVLAATAVIQRRRYHGENCSLPVKEKLLRPPGYSLSRRIETQSEAYTFWMFASFLTAIAAVGAFSFTPLEGGARWMVFAVFTACTSACTIAAWRKLDMLRRNRLGLLGEQVMGELLQPLIAEGCQIFHDIPCDGPWNIDHVVVGPSGVYAIETKAWTKRPGPTGQPAHKAAFDGRIITLSHFTDRHAVGQAETNARWLSTMLTKSTGRAVTAVPLVALPGYFVETLVKHPPTKVLSGKQATAFISKQAPGLAPETIKQVCYQLEQRCRDVGL